MNLPPFTADATCPKCGHDGVRTIYVAEHCSWSTPRCGLTSTDKYHQHLDRRCERCQYEWPQAVAVTRIWVVGECGEAGS
jgi:hypothetical protein